MAYRLNGREFELWKIMKDRDAWYVAVHGSQKVVYD